ncbi:hypothetical protein PAMA_013167 [Pampus argenteus]
MPCSSANRDAQKPQTKTQAKPTQTNQLFRNDRSRWNAASVHTVKPTPEPTPEYNLLFGANPKTHGRIQVLCQQQACYCGFPLCTYNFGSLMSSFTTGSHFPWY